MHTRSWSEPVSVQPPSPPHPQWRPPLQLRAVAEVNGPHAERQVLVCVNDMWSWAAGTDRPQGRPVACSPVKAAHVVHQPGPDVKTQASGFQPHCDVDLNSCSTSVFEVTVYIKPFLCWLKHFCFLRYFFFELYVQRLLTDNTCVFFNHFFYYRFH